MVLGVGLVVVVAGAGQALGALIAQDVVWTSPVNVTVSGNTITKTSGADDTWNADAVSSQTIGAGMDGYVEATALETNTFRMFGLSDENADSSYTSIDYAVYLKDSGYVGVYENGTSRGQFDSYSVGDVFRVQRTGTSVTYLQNDSPFYTSTVPSSSAMMMDASIHTLNGTVGNARIAAAVPEPSTLVTLSGLMGMGLIGHWWRRRRRGR